MDQLTFTSLPSDSDYCGGVGDGGSMAMCFIIILIVFLLQEIRSDLLLNWMPSHLEGVVAAWDRLSPPGNTSYFAFYTVSGGNREHCIVAIFARQLRRKDFSNWGN